MPGISGIVSDAPGAGGTLVEEMVNSMLHEPFYGSQLHVDESQRICVGWTFFNGAIEGRPIWNETKDICLIFCGEHVGSNEISDLSAWLRRYERIGSDSFTLLNGWFSGVLIDRRRRRVSIFNDRYGINRIYYHRHQNGFYFASEAKALLRVLPGVRGLNYQSLGEYFSLGCVLQNRSLYTGIQLLPPASCWTFEAGRAISEVTYFKKEEWENQPHLSVGDYYDHLKAVWARIVPHYLAGDHSVGISLTGGVDSRMILACLPQNLSLPCYTFGGMYRDCADVKVSRKVAKLCGQTHETISLDSGLFREFHGLAEKAIFLTDGTLDVTGATDLYVHRRVRSIAPIRMTGLYGGEILRGLVAFKPMRQSLDHLTPEFAESVRRAGATYAEELKGHRQSFIAFKQAPWHIYSRLSIERTQVTIRTPYFDNEIVGLSYRASPESLTYDPASRLIATAKPELRGIGTDRAVGMESFPGWASIQQAYQQFTYKAEYAYDYGMPQWLARLDHRFARLCPERLFLGRHKYYHFRLWYRDQLSKFVKDVLLDPSALRRNYVHRELLEQIVANHTRGTANFTIELHRLLSIELVQRLLLNPRQEVSSPTYVPLHST